MRLTTHLTRLTSPTSLLPGWNAIMITSIHIHKIPKDNCQWCQQHILHEHHAAIHSTIQHTFNMLTVHRILYCFRNTAGYRWISCLVWEPTRKHTHTHTQVQRKPSIAKKGMPILSLFQQSPYSFESFPCLFSMYSRHFERALSRVTIALELLVCSDCTTRRANCSTQHK